LPANTFTLVGFNLQTPTLAAGNLTGVSGGNTTLTDSNVNFGTLLTVNKTYTIEINAGPGTIDGTVQDFVSWSGNDITVPALPGVAVGDSYAVRQVPTLQEVFPVGFLAGSGFATTADKVWVPVGAGSYVKYWYKTTTPNVGWHTTTSGSNDTGLVTSEVPLVFIDGILIEKKGTAKDFVVSGEVKKNGTNVLLATGFNLVTVAPPVGLTLFTSGLQGDIAGSGFASSADIVWVPVGGGVYTKYWYKTTTPNIGWHTTTTGSNDTGLVGIDVNLPASVFIQRKGSSKVVSFDVPTSYSGL
jgi:hypothetical protein